MSTSAVKRIDDNIATLTLKSLPNFEIEKLKHFLLSSNEIEVDYNNCKDSLLKLIKQNEMYPYYEKVKIQLGIIEDDPEIDALKEKNAQKIIELDAKIDFAQKNFGTSEIKDAILEKANYYFKIGDKENAVKQYELSLEKTVGINSQLEIVLGISRVAFFFNDVALLIKYISIAKEKIEKGGDWELRNRLHIYEAIQLIICRKFKEATELLLNSLSTFNATELISLEELITMDRQVIKKKVLDSSEVLQVVSGDTVIYQLINDYYNCNYENYMQNLVKTSRIIMRDRYLARFCKYFIRQARLPAYKQFLRPYKSVTLQNMSNSFKLPIEFIESELVSYISGMELDCKIDKVNGIIENNITDERNNNYIETIKQGDLLINRIQKLSRIIDM